MTDADDEARLRRNVSLRMLDTANAAHALLTGARGGAPHIPHEVMMALGGAIASVNRLLALLRR